MSRSPGHFSGDSGPPTDTTDGPPPRDLYRTSDIRFVMMELTKLTVQVERLIADVSKGSDKLDVVRHQISFVKGAMWVLGIFGALLWGILLWYLQNHLITH